MQKRRATPARICELDPAAAFTGSADMPADKSVLPLADAGRAPSAANSAVMTAPARICLLNMSPGIGILAVRRSRLMRREYHWNGTLEDLSGMRAAKVTVNQGEAGTRSRARRPPGRRAGGRRALARAARHPATGRR